MIESATPIFNLYRASQFHRKTILEEARSFSFSFLQGKQESNQLLDKWIISEGILMRFYIEQYSGTTDVWIGKTLYRMPDISNNAYLDLAKLDYNSCQALHEIEWNEFHEGYANSNLQEFGITKKNLLKVYFLAATTIFEPEKSNVRVTWAKSQTICKIITSYSNQENTSLDVIYNTYEIDSIIFYYCSLSMTIQQTNLARLLLFIAFAMIILHLSVVDGVKDEDAELLVHIINICSGHMVSKETILHPEYKSLSKLTNRICQHFHGYQNEKVKLINLSTANNSIKCWKEIECDMQTLVELVICKFNAVNKTVKQSFLMVAKTFYYMAYFSEETVDVHISKVLLERVV
ncbi:Copal-8-ol diphosphate hydratase [Olea europaea subsp. europaea]|uniref:Copal-8-ol diphosphate hydratase n=1 Tax=Olea europaea subsp. europaea TaxID=158383 RepID=A0A8S0UFD8_OLEEU|nr:Copal-8-ol diphosphate hydratase [Olea europaea subsp. europaea]